MKSCFSTFHITLRPKQFVRIILFFVLAAATAIWSSGGKASDLTTTSESASAQRGLSAFKAKTALMPQSGSASEKVPARVAASDWTGIKQAYEQQRHEASTTLPTDSVMQQAYLKSSAPMPEDAFGEAVAISGDTVVVGTQFEDGGGGGAGAAYVFVRSGGTWSQQAYLKASNFGAGDNFGGAVAISGDTIVIGAKGEDSGATGVNGDGGNNSAQDAGAAYVFVRNNGVWSQQAYLKASNAGVLDYFGWSVGISGETVVIGAVRESSNASGVNGDGGDNSLGNAGAAYVFVRGNGGWSQQAYLKA